MASSPPNGREAERRHHLRTLAIASTSSAAAATVTSQLWIAGTWIAAALTPVLVTLVSELLNRPAERIARAWTTERPALPEDAEPPSRTAERPRSMPPPGQGAAPVRIYRQPSARRPRRKLAIGAILATAALAFVIAVVTITAGELIAGESIGKGDRRTTFGGGRAQQQEENGKNPVEERQTDTTRQEPSQTEREDEAVAPRDEPTVTTPAPPTTTETTPAPQAETAPAPLTETAPAP